MRVYTTGLVVWHLGNATTLFEKDAIAYKTYSKLVLATFTWVKKNLKVVFQDWQKENDCFCLWQYFLHIQSMAKNMVKSSTFVSSRHYT